MSTDPTSGLLRAEGGKFHLGNRPALDGIRAIGVLCVMFFHLPVIITAWPAGPLPGGFLGVDLFFVLSGFLITSLLCEEYFKTGTLSFRNFYERRTFRLVPALYVVLGVQLIYAAIYHHSLGYSLVFDLSRVGAVALYFFNWVGVYNGSHPIPIGLGVMWSLAVEAQFYLIWPLILYRLLKSNDKRVVLAGIAAVALVGIVIRAVIYHHIGVGVGWAYVYLQTEGRFDDLMVGAAAAFLLQVGWRPTKAINPLGVVALAGFTALAFTVHLDTEWLYYGGYTLVSVLSILIILSVLEPGGTLYTVLSWRPFVWTGERSYALYLWHTFVFAAVLRHWPDQHKYFLLPVAFGASFVVAALSYRFVERPFQQLRKRRRVVADHEGPATTSFAG
jgi:peptidoglycan/LPS O-acetylase OafA/YrhL